MKVIVQFSGGKDSLATLIWAINKYGKDKVEAVFCDTNWEHEITYKHIAEVIEKLQVKLIVLSSKKYLSFLDMVQKKKRFPSTKARFCTEELKTKPMIDYVLEHKEHLILLQGIRKDESELRSKMEKQCSYFKYYSQPYGVDKNGKNKFHTYRKKEVLEWRSKYSDDVLRPVFEWNGQEVINYILDNGVKPNLLYYMGMNRVGCMPCIMAKLGEVKQIANRFPDVINKVREAEINLNSSIMPPNKIPVKYCSKKAINKKGEIKAYPTITDVVKYVNRKDAQQSIFEEDKNNKHICMSFYGICE
jgi:3'-phosphoadenosine 5'-phosphosulfate sulfotransferase (PAPS reductase)/FAD synthetase